MQEQYQIHNFSLLETELYQNFHQHWKLHTEVI